MENNIRENQKNNSFTITWISGISLLLLICVFGFSSSSSVVKGTSAATYKCASATPYEVDGKCCAGANDEIVNGYCVDKSKGAVYNSTYGYICRTTTQTVDNVDEFSCASGYKASCTKNTIGTGGSCYCYQALSSCGVKASNKTELVVDYENDMACWFCSGTYKFQRGENGCNYPVTDLGDVDGNGEINNYDCLAKNGNYSSSSSSSSSSPTVSACWECDKVYKTGTYAQMQNQCGTFNRVDDSYCNNSPSSSSSKSSSSSSSSSSNTKQCYCWDTEDGQTCQSLTSAPDWSYTIQPDSKCTSPSSSSLQSQCHQCNDPDEILHWGSGYASANPECKSGWRDRPDLSQSECQSTYDRCYQCAGNVGQFYWGKGNPGASSQCPTGNWTIRTDLNQSTCKSNSGSSSIPSSSSNGPKTVYVSYNPNGGKIVDNRGGGMDVCGGQSTTCTSGDSCTIAAGSSSCTATINLSAERAGYTFRGWAYVANGTTGITGTIPNLSKNTTMYAVWEECDCDGDDCDDDGDPTPPSSSPTPTPPSSSQTPEPESSSSSNKSSSSSSSKPKPSSIPVNVEENPQTGQIFIFVIWVFGLAAIVYSVWYFRKIKEVNEEQ